MRGPTTFQIFTFVILTHIDDTPHQKKSFITSVIVIRDGRRRSFFTDWCGKGRGLNLFTIIIIIIIVIIINIMKGAYWKAEGDAAREIGREE